MARKPGGDERQIDFFGVPVGKPPEKPGAALAPRPKPPPVIVATQVKEIPAPVVVVPDVTEAGDLEAELARLSPAEVRSLVAVLPDAVLAQFTLATIRQLRRRLERNRRHGGSKSSNTVLDRAAQQLMAELGGQNDDYDD